MCFFAKPSASMWEIAKQIAKQHHLLVCDFHADNSPRHRYGPGASAQSEYYKPFIIEMTSSNANGSGMEEICGKLKSSLLKAAEHVCRSTKAHRWRNKPGGGMRLLTVQSRKSRDAGKYRRQVAARRNIRKPSASLNLLSVWQNPKLNTKSSRILHLAALTFSASPTNWDAITWMSKARNLSAMMLERCDWMTRLSKLPVKSNMSASQM